MVEVRTYTLKPTSLIPNSPHVLIHYPGLFLDKVSRPDFNCAELYDLYKSNGWESQWVARYGPTQTSHYHSAAHEAMTVISGEGATIRFGVADTSDNAEEHTHGDGHEDGGIWVEAKRGDVFILPAGLAHKTYDPKPSPVEFAFFQCKDEDGKVIRDEKKAREFFQGIKIGESFQMMGSYPYGNEWDFAVGGDHKGREKQVWNVPVPERDPVLGDSRDGMRGLWHETGQNRTPAFIADGAGTACRTDRLCATPGRNTMAPVQVICSSSSRCYSPVAVVRGTSLLKNLSKNLGPH